MAARTRRSEYAKSSSIAAATRSRPRRGGHAPGLAAADVGVVCTRDREAELGAGDERDVRKVRAPRVRVVDDVDVVETGLALAHGLNGLRPRAEVDGNVLGLGDHAPVGCEERCGAIT